MANVCETEHKLVRHAQWWSSWFYSTLVAFLAALPQLYIYSESVSDHLEFETLQTFDQNDVKTQKHKKTERK